MNDIDRFLDEDLGIEGDITSDSLFLNEKANANIITKEDCIIAGLDEIKYVLGFLNSAIAAPAGRVIAQNNAIWKLPFSIKNPGLMNKSKN